jgi:AcrR family transcriptional regulator
MPKSTFYNLDAQKKETITRASIREFAQKGFDKGNIETIAKNSNASKGSMYQYFENKHDLYAYSVSQALEITLSDIRTVLRVRTDEDLCDFLYKSFRAVWPVLHKERDSFLLIQSVNFEADPVLRDELRETISTASEGIFLQIIEDDQARGRIRTDIDSRTILIYIDGVSTRFKAYMLELALKDRKDILDSDFADYEKLLTDMMSLIRCGLSK